MSNERWGTEKSWAELEQAKLVHLYIYNGIDMELSVQAHETRIYVNLSILCHPICYLIKNNLKKRIVILREI